MSNAGLLVVMGKSSEIKNGFVSFKYHFIYTENIAIRYYRAVARDLSLTVPAARTNRNFNVVRKLVSRRDLGIAKFIVMLCLTIDISW